MAKKKAKWLEEATDKELIILLDETLGSEPDEKAIAKATKIAAELVERLPEDENALSVTEALDKLIESHANAVAAVKEAYETEIASIEDSEEDEEDYEEDDEDEDEEEEAPQVRTRKGKADNKKPSKKKPPVEEDYEEDDEEEDEDDEGEIDYSDLSIKALKTECRKRGLKVTKGAKKSELIKLLEADDKD